MHKALNTSEIEQLEMFRFATKLESSELSIELHSLQDETVLLHYLENLGPHIGSPNVKVTSSIFVKRYAFLAVIYLYALTAWNKKLDVSFENVILQTKMEEEAWLPTFYFKNLGVKEAPQDRRQWRDEALKELFSDHIHVLINRLSKVTKQSQQILWENISLYIFWLYETVLSKTVDAELLNRGNQDFHYLVQEATGTVFGNHPVNPIKRFYENKRDNHELQEEVRVRKTCCLTYLLKGKKKFCKTCPLMNKSRRNS
mgnify:CR=1 FL=1